MILRTRRRNVAVRLRVLLRAILADGVLAVSERRGTARSRRGRGRGPAVRRSHRVGAAIHDVSHGAVLPSDLRALAVATDGAALDDDLVLVNEAVAPVGRSLRALYLRLAQLDAERPPLHLRILSHAAGAVDQSTGVGDLRLHSSRAHVPERGQSSRLGLGQLEVLSTYLICSTGDTGNRDVAVRVVHVVDDLPARVVGGCRLLRGWARRSVASSTREECEAQRPKHQSEHETGDQSGPPLVCGHLSSSGVVGIALGTTVDIVADETTGEDQAAEDDHEPSSRQQEVGRLLVGEVEDELVGPLPHEDGDEETDEGADVLRPREPREVLAGRLVDDHDGLRRSGGRHDLDADVVVHHRLLHGCSSRSGRHDDRCHGGNDHGLGVRHDRHHGGADRSRLRNDDRLGRHHGGAPEPLCELLDRGELCELLRELLLLVADDLCGHRCSQKDVLLALLELLGFRRGLLGTLGEVLAE